MKLYNTLTKQVEEFEPLEAGKVQMFVCGPTVYDLSHLGHAKTYTQMDVLARVLRQKYEVFYLQNITDLDDKIIERAKEKDISWEDLRTQFEGEYKKDMESLGNTSVTEYARATDYIPDIIRQVQTLMDKGHAYKIDDGIYFEVSTFPDYGKLSGRTEVKENDAQTRIDHSDEKRGWNDFCLWKFSKPKEPVWEAPFGAGRPGWHIEDTAITEHFFGSQYDVHGGAVDLIFPHHEAEITQMEAASGKVPFVKYWVHTGFLNINDAKMAKSTGNFFTIQDVLAKGYDPMAIRLFFLQSHYRSAMNFTWENLDAAANRLKNLAAFADLRWQAKDIENPIGNLKNHLAGYRQRIVDELMNDLNTPQALKWFSELVNEIQVVPEQNIDDFNNFLEFCDSIFGLSLSNTKQLTDEQMALLEAREDARNKNDWALSDKLRDTDLHELGIKVDDRAYGQIWSRL